jgi:photosystem II stability/assembly factor-like uncharacterized protein
MKAAPWIVAVSALLAIPPAFVQGAPASNRSDEGYRAQRTPEEDKFRAGTQHTEPDGDSAKVRREWMRQRMGGELGLDFNEALLQQVRQEQARYPLQGPDAAGAPGMPRWQNIGPTKANFLQNGVVLNAVDSGRARAILPHPNNPDIVYFLTSGGGLWKTNNFTDNKPDWKPLTDGLFSTSGGSVAFGRQPNTLFLGTGDPFDFPFTVKGLMYKSTNGGSSWSAAWDLGATLVADVKVDTSAATDIVLVGTDFGLFRSTDAGATYTSVVSGGLDENSIVWSLAKTSAGWIAAAENFFTLEGTLYVSTDKGATWAPIPNAGGVYAGAGRTTLGVGTPGDSVVYAFAADTGDGAQLDLFRSTDGGLNWTALGLAGKVPTNPSTDQPNMDLMGGQAFYNQLVLVNPSDPTRRTVYLGGQLASARSRDGGATWTLISDWLAQDNLPYVHADFHAAAYSKFGNNETLFFGTDGGLFISNNDGNRWKDNKNEGLVTHLIYSLSSGPKKTGRIITGMQDNGSRYRRDQGTTYNQVLGGDGFGTGWSQANDAISIASVYFGFIFRNDTNPPNTQNKWDVGYTGIDQDDASFFTPMTTPTATVDPTGLVFYTYTHHNVYKTTDGALTWQPIGVAGQGGLPASAFFRDVVHGLGVSPIDGNRVGVAGTGGRIFLTRDGGTTWTTATIGSFLPGFSFTANVAFANNEVVYVASENPVVGVSRVAKSVDGGLTWTAADSGLPQVPVLKIQVDPRNGSTLYAATYLGVYRSTNAGGTWQKYGNGLPSVVAADIYMPPDGGFLRVATFGRGVWEINF